MKKPNYHHYSKASRIVSIAALSLALTQGSAHAQNWQLVWADEFNGSIGPDWVHDVGGGGWGNNEQQYYQPQNATIVNHEGLSCLAITAKNESVGGKSYTSSRLKTQGKRSWKYGKIVASIKMPSFSGQWPAFWMLGDNIGSVGWPACGEIDIMEQVNTNNISNGATHWSSGGAQADWSATFGTNIQQFHEYSIEWDSQYIRWKVDNYQYAQFYIGGNTGNTHAFNQNNFFVILNLAVGGNWPGFSINNGALPASMYVDWVRVYQDNGGLADNRTFRIQARHSGKCLDAYYALTANGTQLATSTYNGGANVKWVAHNRGGNQYCFTGVQSGRAVDVPGWATADIQLHLWDYFANGAQTFTCTGTDNGYHQVTNVNSGKVWDVYYAGTGEGTPVYQSTWWGGWNQQWSFLQP